MKEFNFSKRLIHIITLTILLSLSLCGCFELGDYEEGEYFEYFPSVKLIDKEENGKNYSVEDYFYTEEGVNDFVSDIPYKQYLYLCIQVDKNLLLNELNLSFCSNEECSFEISAFISNDIPNDIRGYDEPLYDDENNLIKYDDPTNPLTTKIIHLNANKWVSSYILNYGRNDYIAINEGQYIILRFENNSFVGKEKGLSLATFTTTNLLIRAERS